MRVARNFMIEKELIDKMQAVKEISMSEIVNKALFNYFGIDNIKVETLEEIEAKLKQFENDIIAHKQLGEHEKVKAKEEAIKQYKLKKDILIRKEKEDILKYEREKRIDKLSSFQWTDDLRAEYKQAVKDGVVKSSVEFIEMKQKDFN